ncbi:hypothetical protein ASPCAL00350 [Aspergillus calidoustus]|uniref:Uncharacterized protein n=1 Tax=Aspergillus calidoustus TaxID=454130 RepID=A0A0U5FMR5_ASPCI|nr:hypothetical protein ASPCAL00350 [Aspergillus calidoustus]
MTIYTSTLAPFSDITNLSIPQFMTRYNPDGVSADKVVHMDTFSNEHLTYGSLREKASRAAWGLKNQLGVRPGDAVLAIVTNSNDFVLLAHATWWAGGVFAPLNTSSTQKDIEHVLKLVKPTHIAIIASKLTQAQNATAALGITPKLFTVLSKVAGIPQFPTDIAGTDPKSQALPPFDLNGKSAQETPSTICFSSGTTGNMKGVLMSHYNLVNNLMQMRVSLPSRLVSGIREVWFTPYCHIYGLSAVVFGGMWTGATFLGLPSFDLETFCRKSSELQATDMHLVPPVALLLTTSGIALKYDVPSVERIVIAAAPLKEALQRKLKKRFPRASICQGYGLTECSPGVTHQLDDTTSSCGTVGKLVAGTEARLVDPTTGRDVEPGQEGELWVRGPQVMMGYINDPEATAATFSEGWLRTGDIMRMDEDQNFWVTDRLKEMIKYKGFQIAPSELEDLLLRHPHVTDAAICAIYDDSQATEVPLAYVSLTPDKAGLPQTEVQSVLEEIRKWADGQLAGYKRLRGGAFHLQTLPKTPTGKILRRLLPAKVKEGRGGRL